MYMDQCIVHMRVGVCRGSKGLNIPWGDKVIGSRVLLTQMLGTKFYKSSMHFNLQTITPVPYPAVGDPTVLSQSSYQHFRRQMWLVSSMWLQPELSLLVRKPWFLWWSPTLGFQSNIFNTRLLLNPLVVDLGESAGACYPISLQANASATIL